MLYTSMTMAMAVLETLAHLGSALPLNRYQVQISVPDGVWAAREIIEKPPVGWDAEPSGLASLEIGDRWLAEERSALLVVPSVIVPNEHNVLINPAHPDAKEITAEVIKKWTYDFRLVQHL